MKSIILLPAHGKTWTPPTPAQAEAGNYFKPTVNWRGLIIKVENPAGSVRKWDGGQTLMHYDYGYIRGTDGVDGDEVDVYLGPSLNFAPMVYVVHQRRAGDWEKYDEDKAMLGFLSEDQARDAYLKQYDDPRFLGAITAMPVEEFVEKVKATKGRPKMIKAHISGYRRQDGTPVAPHEDRRPPRKSRVKTYGRFTDAEAQAAVDALKAGRAAALREIGGPALDSLLVSIHASNRRVRELVAKSGQPAESVADATLEALSGMDPRRLVRLHGWSDLITHLRAALRGLVVALRRGGRNGAADWLQDKIGDWTDDDIGRLLLRADRKIKTMAKGHSMDTLNRLLGDFGQQQPTILFFKSYVKPTSYVKNGKTVQRRGYTDSRTKKLEGAGGKDPYTGDLFADQAPPKKPMGPSPYSDAAMREPEKHTGDLFDGDKPTDSAHAEGDNWVMPIKEAIAEHKELVHVAETPGKADDKAEMKEQKAELGRMEAAFDSEAWDKAREERIKASKASGVKHLDDFPAYVETLRGKPIYYVHDHKEHGVVRTVDNRGNVYIDWGDEYSAKKNLATKTMEKKKAVWRTSLGRSDLKDYAVGKPPKDDLSGGVMAKAILFLRLSA